MTKIILIMYLTLEPGVKTEYLRRDVTEKATWSQCLKQAQDLNEAEFLGEYSWECVSVVEGE